MADFWKSQARKFCDFCKCWIADNKPSIQFHESGKKHKENVARKISDISKKSAKALKAAQEYKDDIKSMEEAAMKAYMKDVETNRDYTAQKILEAQEKLRNDNKESTVSEHEGPSTGITENKSADVKQWYEAKSDEGHIYYWNIITSESKWEPPEEGFLSIDEQEKEAKAKKKKDKAEKQKEKAETQKEKEADKQKKEEGRALKEREKMKKRKVKDSTVKAESSKAHDCGPCIGPAPRINPYGNWTTVEKVEEKPLDLQLPQQEYVVIKVPEYTEPTIKFKEKTLQQTEDQNESSGGFKKRKLNAVNKKSNMRQRLDDD